MVQQLSYNVTKSYYEDDKCTSTEKCSEKYHRCDYNNCCNHEECLYESNALPFKFENFMSDYKPGSSNNKINNNNNINNNKVKYNIDIDTKSETKTKINNNNVDFNNNEKSNINITTNENIYLNKFNNKEIENNNRYNDNSIIYNNTINSVKDNSNINNSNDSNSFISNNKGDNKINLVSISTISIIIIIIFGILYSVFFIQKKRKAKKNEKYLNTTYKSEFSLSLLNDELKDPIESCEEYINALSRLRYKDPISVYDPENPLQTFHLFLSPSLSSNESFFASTRQSDILVPETIKVDP